jgi:hypothetical protein
VITSSCLLAAVLMTSAGVGRSFWFKQPAQSCRKVFQHGVSSIDAHHVHEICIQCGRKSSASQDRRHQVGAAQTNSEMYSSHVPYRYRDKIHQ